MIAHYWEHNTREGFVYEETKKHAGDKGAADPLRPRMDIPSWSQYHQPGSHVKQ